MPSTCTPGITVDAAGQRIIDKEHRGVRIYIRLGSRRTHLHPARFNR